MDIGVPREIHRHEHRVGLTPFAVQGLSERGHNVFVESMAGESAYFSDQRYMDAGAQITYSRDEVYNRSELISRVSVLSSDEVSLLKPGSIIAGFQHLAVASKKIVERLIELGTTIIGYEIIRNEKGDLRILLPFSEMAGHMAVQIAAHYSQIEAGGRGVLLGNIPGVPPPTVLILGAGSVGRTAARQAQAVGAHVIVIDTDVSKLQKLNELLEGRAVTMVFGTERLEKYTSITDILIGAVLVPGGRPPIIVTEAMVKGMKKGSVIIDISIDQGGCVETSRPTTIENPTFEKHGVIHYCVPNMTANIARTASRALASAAIPYLLTIAEKGLTRALNEDPGLAQGIYLYRGKVVNKLLGDMLNIDFIPLEQLLEEDEGS
jgi:alanine dehydrogenase